MASFRAISGIGEAVIELLRTGYDPDEFNNTAEFKVFTSQDFTDKTISNGASLFVYRIFCNGAFRTPPSRISDQGARFDTQLPIEVHFLVTIWGTQASFQNELAGWIMRLLEDTPILPASFLNSSVPGVFHDDETVDIILAELRTEDLFRIWDVLGLNAYQLSIPYVARVVKIDSLQPKPVEPGDSIQKRQFEFGIHDGNTRLE